MRDGASGRSRGFGFLTFKDPKVVNTVMVKEHFLDGKIVRPNSHEDSVEKQVTLGSTPPSRLERYRQKRNKCLHIGAQIDPKRAIPRDEQEKTSKIFVGGVSQEATEDDFTTYFEQFGRVVDATLMMDKDTGRPRGFGFVTFDSEAAVERVLEHQPLEIMGKAIEVKKAQPRGKMGEEEHDQRGGRKGKFGRDGNFDNQQSQSQPMQNPNMTTQNGMTPQMMAQYWQKMQQWFAMMQQMQTAQMGGMGGMQMNPAMMTQMQNMQNMQGGMQNMTPQMQQQMMQMMQMQGGGGGMNMNQNMGQQAQRGFSAAEQLAFEQRKYEQQAQRRGPRNNFQNQGQPQSWEGMYDGEPQPDSGKGGAVRNKTSKSTTPQPPNAPAGAPTGPKNPGKPSGTFRGGRGGGRYHPYGR